MRVVSFTLRPLYREGNKPKPTELGVVLAQKSIWSSW